MVLKEILAYVRLKAEQALPDESVSEGIDVLPDSLKQFFVAGDLREFLEQLFFHSP